MCIVGLGFAGRSCPIMQDTLQTAENDNPNAVQVLAMEGAQHGWITAWGMLCQRWVELWDAMQCLQNIGTISLVKFILIIFLSKVWFFCMYSGKNNRNSLEKTKYFHLLQFLQWEYADFRLVTRNSPMYIWGWKNNHVTSLERDLKFTEVNEKAPVGFKWIQPLHGEQKTCVSSA